MRFVNRERELEILREFWESEEPGIFVIYGRRRVGKTRLVLEFMKKIVGRKLYLLASRRPIEHNLRKFSEKIAEAFRIPGLRFKNFQEMFEFLSEMGEKILVVIDEFGYLVEQDEGVLSDFQEIADFIIPKGKVKLIISGSIITLMESRVLGIKSPFYGRYSAKLKLQPLSFWDIFSWFNGIRYEDAVIVYSVTGGVPRYLEFFEGREPIAEVEKNFFRSESFLFSDAEYLLKEELREPSVYFQILEAIAMGYNTITEIANYAFTKPTSVTPYLQTLREMGIIRRVLSFGKKRGRGIYEFSDLYMMFWFRFVNPYKEEIESGFVEEAINNFRKNFNSYLGLAFEHMGRGILRDYFSASMRISRCGRWWSGGEDIDFIIVDDEAKEAVICEIKWRDMSEREAIREAAKLEERAERIRELQGYKKKYCVFARKVDGSGYDNYLFLDLERVCKEVLRRAKKYNAT